MAAPPRAAYVALLDRFLAALEAKGITNAAELDADRKSVV